MKDLKKLQEVFLQQTSIFSKVFFNFLLSFKGNELALQKGKAKQITEAIIKFMLTFTNRTSLEKKNYESLIMKLNESFWDTVKEGKEYFRQTKSS